MNRFLSETLQDIRYGVRQLVQHRSFTIVTIFILALGIGGTTAIFSVLNSMILRPLPVRDPQRLVTLSAPFRANAGLRSYWSYGIWQQIRNSRQLFGGTMAWSEQRFNLSSRGEAEPASGIFVSGDYFATLGVSALTGRTLNAGDDVPGGGPDGLVAMISYGLWQRRYAGVQNVAGRQLSVDGVPFTIVGVMPREFFGTEVGRTIDVAVPLGAEPSIHASNAALGAPDWYWLTIMLRLKPNQSMEAANAALHVIGPGIIQNSKMPSDLPVQFVPQLRSEPFAATSGITGVSTARAQYNRPLTILLATVAALLVIACANVANLLLARAVVRRYEITVRLALGASRWRLVRQSLAESLILSSASAIGGLLITGAFSRTLVAQLSLPADPVFLDLSFDWRVMTFTAALAVATAIVFGMAPAWTSVRTAPIDALNERGRGNSTAGRGILSSSLVVAQIGLSVVLLIIGGLFIRTFTNLTHVSTGFEINSIGVMDLSLAHASADGAKRLALFQELVSAARTVPGIEQATGSFVTPISDSGFGGTIELMGQNGPARPGTAFINFVTPGWFQTYGIRLRDGRDFRESDNGKAQPVAVVNNAFVRRFMGAKNPIGETVKYSFNGGDFSTAKTIVGVAHDAVYRSLREGMRPTLYMPLTQWEMSPLMNEIAISVRGVDRLSGALTRSMVDALTRVDGDITFTARPLAEQMNASLTRERAVAQISGCFGAVALVLANIGLYGLMSYSVSRRRAEMGIRIALGGTPAMIMRMVFRRAYPLVLLGIGLGSVVAFWASRFVASLLYEIDPHDTRIMAAAAFALIIAAAVAVWLPAARISRTDPATVLKAE
jgi:putative ABC transport system permease protein